MSINKIRPSTGRKRRRLSAGAVATALTVVGLPLAATSASALLDPNVGPAAPHSIIVFPARDFVHLDGYNATDVLTVKVLRAGSVVGTTLPFSPDQFDPKAGHFMADINHLGPPCWDGFTPDIIGGDVIQVLTSPTTGDQTPTSGVTVTSPATETSPGSGTVVMTGTAPDAAAPGGRTPIDQLNARIIAKKQLFSNGRRLLRADSIGTARDGLITYDSATGSAWTATFNGLNTVAADGVRDADKAVNQGESRGQWLGRVPLAVNENTIFEWNLFGGPAAGCNLAPATPTPTVPDLTTATDSGISALDNITSNPSPTFVGATGDPLATSANLYVDNLINGTATVVGGNYSLTPATPLADGPHTVMVSETKAPAITESLSKGSLPITVDTIAPTVATRVPAVNATLGSLLGNLTATFSENVNGVSGTTFTLKRTSTGTAIPAAVSTTARVATLDPTTVLGGGTSYTTTLSSGVKDVAGNLLTATSSPFVSGLRPTVLGTYPVANAVAVSRLTNVYSSFSESVSGVSSATFTLWKTATGVRVPVVVSYNPVTHLAMLNPGVTLAANTTYTATVFSGIRDASGNPLTSRGWRFTTGLR